MWPRIAMLNVPPADIARRHYDIASPALLATSATTSRSLRPCSSTRRANTRKFVHSSDAMFLAAADALANGS
jgi:hypothetical protein